MLPGQQERVGCLKVKVRDAGIDSTLCCQGGATNASCQFWPRHAAEKVTPSMSCVFGADLVYQEPLKKRGAVKHTPRLNVINTRVALNS